MEDNVNHPKHYKVGRYETIDVIEDIASNYGGYSSYLVGNIIKYLSRAPHKGNRFEDLRKAQFYLNRLVKEESMSKSNTVVDMVKEVMGNPDIVKDGGVREWGGSKPAYFEGESAKGAGWTAEPSNLSGRRLPLELLVRIQEANTDQELGTVDQKGVADDVLELIRLLSEEDSTVEGGYKEEIYRLVLRALKDKDSNVPEEVAADAATLGIMDVILKAKGDR